ncbi:MAG: hypothetical protein Q4P83_07250, partial [Spirochaetales bacterium]|nr:hypothetical protein [Spirochaetales bacterium]
DPHSNKPTPPPLPPMLYLKNRGGGVDFFLNLVSAGFAKNFNIFLFFFVCQTNFIYGIFFL